MPPGSPEKRRIPANRNEQHFQHHEINPTMPQFEPQISNHNRATQPIYPADVQPVYPPDAYPPDDILLDRVLNLFWDRLQNIRATEFFCYFIVILRQTSKHLFRV